MVQPEIIYLKLLLKVNKGNSFGNIAIDKARFVLLFNECKNRWVENHLKEKDSILIDSLWETLKTVDLTSGVDKDSYVEFNIPGDFYEIVNATCIAQRDDCKREIFLREIKNQDKSILRFDANLKPDFDWKWGFFTIQSGTINVYKTDFKVNKTTIEYYKVIPDIDIAGYIRLDGTPSTNKPIDISEQYVDQIINLAAEEFMRDFQDSQGLQIAKDRTNSQE